MSCYRREDDWASQANPWRALDDLIVCYEAEFSGRVLIGPVEYQRWQNDVDGLCWALIGVEGFDPLVRSADDIERLPALFDRGVRLFQPVYTANNALGGSSSPGDERGLTELGRAFLQRLSDVGGIDSGPRPIFDLAHMNPQCMGDVLAWFEEDSGRLDRVIPVYSHGCLSHEGFDSPRAITDDNLRRLRALGGRVGVTPAFYPSAETLRNGILAIADVPFRGQAGFEGLALGTDFLGIDHTPSGLGTVESLASWAVATFPTAQAEALLAGTARALLREAAGSTV
jgi:membrane dipeptidase